MTKVEDRADMALADGSPMVALQQLAHQHEGVAAMTAEPSKGFALSDATILRLALIFLSNKSFYH